MQPLDTLRIAVGGFMAGYLAISWIFLCGTPEIIHDYLEIMIYSEHTYWYGKAILIASILFFALNIYDGLTNRNESTLFGAAFSGTAIAGFMLVVHPTVQETLTMGPSNTQSLESYQMFLYAHFAFLCASDFYVVWEAMRLRAYARTFATSLCGILSGGLIIDLFFDTAPKAGATEMYYKYMLQIGEPKPPIYAGIVMPVCVILMGVCILYEAVTIASLQTGALVVSFFGGLSIGPMLLYPTMMALDSKEIGENQFKEMVTQAHLVMLGLLIVDIVIYLSRDAEDGVSPKPAPAKKSTAKKAAGKRKATKKD
eukprot:Clim_evm2s44 gene=Clim_evmTU2s44